MIPINNKRGSEKQPFDTIRQTPIDRIECAKTFTEFASKAAKGEVEVKGKRIGLNDFTKDALLKANMNESEINILNAQWVSNSSQTKALGKMIAMVDVSGSMNGDPLHAAIALGCRIAEKSVLGKRALTFSSTPHWIRLDDCDTFTSMVQRMQHAQVERCLALLVTPPKRMFHSRRR